MTAREQLRNLLVERSVRLGDFTLASGAKSDYYIDARRTTMTAEGQRLLGIVGYEAIVASGLAPTHVGGLTLGADPVSYAIAHRSSIEGHPIDGFTVRKKAKDHGTGQLIEGGVPEAAEAIMVEDTMTTGRSTLQAVEAMQAHGASVIGVLTVIDRSGGSAEALYREMGLTLISLFDGPELVEAARANG